jgi:flotillin
MSTFSKGDGDKKTDGSTSAAGSLWVKYAKLGAGATAIGAAIAFVIQRYHIAAPSTYLVRTGLGMQRPQLIARSAMRWPLQRIDTIRMAPEPVRVVLDAMSEERIRFKLPGVFVVGVKDTPSALQKYSTVMIEMDAKRIEDTVKATITGILRVQAGTMPLNKIFNDRMAFQKEVVVQTNEQLDSYGMTVYSANLDDLQDMDDSNYFKSASERALKGAVAEARVAVAAAEQLGKVGEKKNDAETRTRTAEMEKDATIAENNRKREIAESAAALAVKRADYDKQIKVAEAEAKSAAEKRTNELQQQVEAARHQQQVEQRRATQLAEATVNAEALERKALGEANAKRTHAAAELYAQQCRANGVLANMTAQANGLGHLVEASGGSVERLTNWLMVERDMYKPLAEANAKALQGLKPKYTIWQRSGGADDDPIQKILTTLPHYLDTIQKQTGYNVLPQLFVPPGKGGNGFKAHKTDGSAPVAMSTGETTTSVV